jgi:hypothetical protein
LRGAPASRGCDFEPGPLAGAIEVDDFVAFRKEFLAFSSGRIDLLGHTPQADVLDLGHLICLDTGCYNGGWLTALDVASRQKWQANERGNLRAEQSNT